MIQIERIKVDYFDKSKSKISAKQKKSVNIRSTRLIRVPKKIIT